ncbi:hypothetical protein KPL71_021830 [Citrus sinensis]|uniref:Uncharacterized protein n=1 Tax=Citrus sinensis TaxID=2711 RepID=A0ACB8JI76_CITSI|nr:hypothetical protein KPL71_021830 [Citrus sinensis]
MLDQMGYSVKIESGEMMIIKGTKIIMKGLRKNGVFVLDGEVVTCEVGVSVDANTNKTRLWHLRLGHIGVRGLKELDNQGLLEGDKIGDLEFCESCVLGKATRASFNRTLMERVRSMLVQSKLPKTLWAEILLTACHLVNLSPSTAIEFKTPYERWTGQPANYGNLRAFGCPAYAHTSQGKLAPRALKGFFIGYPEGVKGYKIWCTDLSPPRCIISRDVTFNEKELLNQKSAQQPTKEDTETGKKQQFEVELSKSDDSLEAEDSGGVIDSSTAHQIDEDEPKVYKEAVQSKFNKEWQQAMDEEIMSLYKNDTWELVKKPDKRRVVNCKWIFKVKDGLTGDEPKRFKARLVLKGYTQKEWVDFKEVFSPVVRHASIRVILALTAVQDMELDQLDVKTAFLHGRLQEEIFMTQPEGYVDSMKPRHIYLLLYVDDMLIACKRRDEIEKLKVMLNSEFDMKDLGTAKKILGVEIKRNRTKGEIFLSQERYLTKVLETYKMLDSKPVLTPLAAHFKLSNQLCPKTDEEKLDMKNVPYANAVGCIMYAMVLTRPDLSHSVSVVSRYMAQPGREHWRAVKWIMRYLHGSLSHGLVYGKSKGRSDGLLGFVDSDYAGDLDRRRSLTGFMFMYEGCLINWKASLQHVVALSTTEAEYTTATEAVKEALWLQGLLGELGVRQKSVTIHCDSSSAIHLCKNPAHHERTKHIDIKLHFIINEVSKGAVKMAKVHTDENPADMLTKAVPSANFNICLDLAGLSSL